MTGTADDHTATLRSIANMIEQRNLFPEPWNLLAVGCPMRGDRLYVNYPQEADCTSQIQVLSSPMSIGLDPTFWARYGTWLRTTREARLVAREDQWKKKNGKSRISSVERTKIAASVFPTSLFDCLWRLRIKSNYGTIDPYLVKHIPEDDHRIFNQALCVVTQATLGLLELYIMRRIGRSEYTEIADDFVRRDSSDLSKVTLQARRSS